MSVTSFPRAAREGGEIVTIDRHEPRYDRLGKIGEGGMGLVELVRDNDIGRLVAVKRLKRPGEPHTVLRFAREARCLGQLEHPGIVPVHDVGRNEDGTYFLVMKHLEGETLEEIIRRLREGDAETHAAYPMHDRIRICESVLRIMEYAHERGVVHRDLKPGNVMIGRHGEVTIVDWGLARRIDGSEEDLDEAESETTMGTPLYMSPEQASGGGGSVGPASDIYTMAVVFYELLTLEHYLEGSEDLDETLRGVRERKARLAYWVESPHQSRVPIELAYWIQKAMRKEPASRFGSVAEMRLELQRAAEGQFDVVCPTTFSRRFFRMGMDAANRRPVLILAAMLTAAALAGYGAFRIVESWL